MLRLLSLLSAVAVAFSPFASFAADAPDATAIVKKGIAFLGGEKTLKSFKAATFADKGTYYGMGEGLPYTGKYAVLWPDKTRMEIVGVFTQVLNGNAGWVDSQGSVTDMTKQQLLAKQNLHYESIVTTLYPLLDGKTFTLKSDGTETIGKVKGVAVKVQSKGKPDVRLVFNPSNGELLKSQMMAMPDDMSDKLVKQETFYSNYKTAKGVKYATKLLIQRAGRKYIETTVTDYKPLETLSEKTFAKPK